MLPLPEPEPLSAPDVSIELEVEVRYFNRSWCSISCRVGGRNFLARSILAEIHSYVLYQSSLTICVALVKKLTVLAMAPPIGERLPSFALNTSTVLSTTCSRGFAAMVSTRPTFIGCFCLTYPLVKRSALLTPAIPAGDIPRSWSTDQAPMRRIAGFTSAMTSFTI